MLHRDFGLEVFLFKLYIMHSCSAVPNGSGRISILQLGTFWMILIDGDNRTGATGYPGLPPSSFFANSIAATS